MAMGLLLIGRGLVWCALAPLIVLVARQAGAVAGVPATMESFATGPAAPTNNTEILHLVSHGRRMFAATGQWMSPRTDGAQILVKETASAPWRVFDRFAVLRVTMLESITVPARHNRGRRTQVLLTQGRRGPPPAAPTQLLWLQGDAERFDGAFALPRQDQVRAVGARAEADGFAFYAGAEPSGVLRGVWDADGGTIRWSATPELSVEAPGASRKVTSFAECNRSMFATIDQVLYRRNDGALAPGVPRWTPWFRDPEARESGLRAATCILHRGRPALLVSSEGPGTVYRFDDLAAAAPTVTVELDAKAAVADGLRSLGTTGDPRPLYVITAYNEFSPVKRTTRGAGGGNEGRRGPAHLFGVEWNYVGLACPPERSCQPQRGFDAGACIFLRWPAKGSADPRYDFRCLGGPEFQPASVVPVPVTRGDAFVAVRTFRMSPFGDRRLYVGGFDANFVPADDTAWIATVDWQAAGLGRR